MSVRSLLLAVVLSALPCAGLRAQQEAVPPAIEIPMRVEMFEALGAIEWGVQNRAVSVSIENGVKTVRAAENGQHFEIVEDPQAGITVTATRQFRSENEEQLAEEHPDLYMHLKAFPTESDGSKVALTIGVTTTFEAANADELKSKYPDAFAVYEKYAQGTAAQMRLGGFRDPALRLPAPRMLGREGLATPPRIVIRPPDADEDSQQQQREDEKDKQHDPKRDDQHRSKSSDKPAAKSGDNQTQSDRSVDRNDR